MEVFVEQEKRLPVVGSYDTVVVGGGFAGVAAALAAARGGNKVLLCERIYMLGGLGTAGLITIYLPLCDGRGHQVSFGIAEELLKLSISHGSEFIYGNAWFEDSSFEEKCGQRYKVRYNASVCAILMEQLLLENGVEILYGTTVCDIAVSDNVISHLIIENKSGRSAIETGNVIDCSGDADICRYAGENTALYAPGNGLAAWYYFANEKGFNLSQVGVLDTPESTNTDEMRISDNFKFAGVDAKEISKMMQISHKTTLNHFLARGELSDTNMLANIATIPQLRMTRRLCGVTTQDCVDRQYFDDSVGLFSDWRQSGPVYELPYSALYGNKIKNLAVAGRCISVTDEMWDVTRVIPVCAVSGEAVGTAAAMGKNFADVDVIKLQEKLRENGVKIHTDEVL